jgi:hypothetical protein
VENVEKIYVGSFKIFVKLRELSCSIYVLHQAKVPFSLENCLPESIERLELEEVSSWMLVKIMELVENKEEHIPHISQLSVYRCKQDSGDDGWDSGVHLLKLICEGKGIGFISSKGSDL